MSKKINVINIPFKTVFHLLPRLPTSLGRCATVPEFPPCSRSHKASTILGARSPAPAVRSLIHCTKTESVITTDCFHPWSWVINNQSTAVKESKLNTLNSWIHYIHWLFWSSAACISKTKSWAFWSTQRVPSHTNWSLRVGPSIESCVWTTLTTYASLWPGTTSSNTLLILNLACCTGLICLSLASR